MDAIMIAGLAVVVVGGYYSVMDFLADIGLSPRKMSAAKNLHFSCCGLISSQRTVKQMARMNI